MSKAKRTTSKKRTSKTRTKAPPVSAAVVEPTRQPTLPGVSAKKEARTHFALYLSSEQRELAERLARHMSTPWDTVSINAALRAAFLRGAVSLLKETPGNAAKSGD